MKLTFLWLLVFIISVHAQFTEAQSKYEPLHGVTGYDYSIKGELELRCTHFIVYKDGNKQEGIYHIKSPVLLPFNRNDLEFFKVQPREFIGYVENQFIASCGEPCGGGLISIPEGGYQEEENWMWINEHVKWWDNGELTEFRGQGEIYPVLKVFFSIPDYPERYQAGLDQLRFRILIVGTSDSKYYPTRNVVVEYFDNKFKRSAGENQIDAETMKKMKLADPALAAEMKEISGLLQDAPPDLSVIINCGSFYGSDLTNALMSGNLIEADKTRKEAFECRFEQEYFKNLPHIDAMKLINYLIKPVGNYEIPVQGSFSADSEYGSERTTYEGTLRFRGNQVRKHN